MITDIHTHLWHSPEQLGPAAASWMRDGTAEPWDPSSSSVEAYDRAMQPVGCAVILGFQSAYLQGNITHEQVAEYVQRRPDKYLGFAGIDPMGSNPIEDTERAVDLGLVGVVVSPSGQGCHPTHTRAMKLYEKCEQMGLPILFHPATHLGAPAMLEFSQPHLLDEVARSFPGLRMVIGQIGHPWVGEALTVLGKHEHVYADLTDLITRPWDLYQALIAANERGAMGRLLFGSDYPFVSPQDAIMTMYSINTLTHGTHLPSIPRERLRGVIERDALQCLGLEPPSGAPSARGERVGSASGLSECITITAVSPSDIRPRRNDSPSDVGRSEHSSPDAQDHEPPAPDHDYIAAAETDKDPTR